MSARRVVKYLVLDAEFHPSCRLSHPDVVVSVVDAVITARHGKVFKVVVVFSHSANWGEMMTFH